MSYVVRRIGGGNFSPYALCFSPNEQFLFVGCGCLINIYSIPDLELIDQRHTHKAKISSMVCSEEYLITGDSDGMIYFHRLNMMTILDKKPDKKHEHKLPIEKLIFRNKKLFIIHYEKPYFYLTEFNNPNPLFKGSIFNELFPPSANSDYEGIRFTVLDAFDIDNNAHSIVVADECKLRGYNFKTKSKILEINLQQPARICRFRSNDIITFTKNGRMFQYGPNQSADTQWHFVCPNSVVFNDYAVYSGGVEGVLLINKDRLRNHLLETLPRVGRTIEGLALSPLSTYIAAIADKNILTLIDQESKFVQKYISHVTGDVNFANNIIVSARSPNLIQFFDSKTAKCIEQLQISSYNCTVPITAFALTNEYLVTVETSKSKQNNSIDIEQEVDYRHKSPHADIRIAKDTRKTLMTQRRFYETRHILKMVYSAKSKKDSEDNIENVEIKTVEGNPLIHDRDASQAVNYSEIKIWNRIKNVFEIEQSFRIIGKPVYPISVHPNMPVYAMVVAKELQLWKKTENWQMWKTCRLIEVPNALVWAPDGSLLIIQYRNGIVLLDSDSFDSICQEYQFEADIVSISFINDCEILVHTKSGLAIFDLRSVSISTFIYVHAAICNACANCYSFVVQKEQPIVVLNQNNVMTSWQVPTKERIKAMNLIEDKNGLRVVLVDEDNFIWSVEHFEPVEKEFKLTTITAPQPKKLLTKSKVELKTDKTKEILSILDVPSHQVPSISDLCDAMFDLFIEEKKQEDVANVTIKIDEPEESQEVDTVPLSTQDMIQLRNFFNQ